MKRQVVVMPYCYHFDDKKRLICSIHARSGRDRHLSTSLHGIQECEDPLSDLIFDDVLDRCVDSFADKKMVHKDAAGRHVAVVPIVPADTSKNIELRYTFIDLSSVDVVDTKEEAMTAFANELKSIDDV